MPLDEMVRKAVGPTPPELLDPHTPQAAAIMDRALAGRPGQPGPGPIRPRSVGLTAVIATAAAAAVVIIGIATPALVSDRGHPSITQPRIGRDPQAAYIGARLISAIDAAANEVLVVKSHATAAVDIARLYGGDQLELCDSTQWLSPAEPHAGQEIQLRWHYDCAGELVPVLGLTQDMAVSLKNPVVTPTSPNGDLFFGDAFAGSGSVTCSMSRPDGTSSAYSGALPAVTIDAPNGAAALITQEIAQGRLDPTGRTTIAGRLAITLEISQVTPESKTRSTLWIDANSYLPIMATEHFDHSTTISDITLSFSYLPRTAGNLRELDVTPPATAAPAAPSPSFCPIGLVPSGAPIHPGRHGSQAPTASTVP
jgi:hypothetical protein